MNMYVLMFGGDCLTHWIPLVINSQHVKKSQHLVQEFFDKLNDPLHFIAQFMNW